MDHEFSDFCDGNGARRLKQRIEAFWGERGYAVNVKLVEAGFAAAMRSVRTDIRSDMINGLPSPQGKHAQSRPRNGGVT